MPSQQAPSPPRVLIIEDEPLLAYVLEEVVRDAGFAIAGTATRLPPALELIAAGTCDAAILDANLAGVSAGPAALALTTAGVPFIVLSGYAPDQQSRAFAAGTHLQKPCRPERLIEVLQGLLESRR